MAKVKVDLVDPHALQALRTSLFNIRRIIFVPGSFTAELGSQEDFVSLASPGKPFAKKVLTVMVNICSVPECHPGLMDMIQ